MDLKFETRPFYSDPVKQVNLVDLTSYDFSKLNYIEDLVINIYFDNKYMENENPKRKFNQAKSVRKRIKELEKLQKRQLSGDDKEMEI